MAAAPLRENVFADDEQRAEASALVARLEDSMQPQQADVTLPSSLHLSKGFARLLATVLTKIAEGRTVTVGSLPQELTTTVAAEQLGISRTTLMKHIRSGRLASHEVGTHTRLWTKDVLDFRRELIQAQRASLDALLAMEDELDIR
ncbi:helix-turn-helix domain-containing protein [Georgenia halophila]